MNRSIQRKALVIGCGLMGGATTGRRRGSESHAGVLAANTEIDTLVFDIQKERASSTAKALQLAVVDELDAAVLKDLDLVVISSPTETHAHYLRQLLSAQIPLIVCEKPLCKDPGQLADLIASYDAGKSRVVVNYTRRFLKGFHDLKGCVRSLSAKGPLRACLVRYQRGFLNNGSHAMDLLRFLLEWDIQDAEIRVTHSVHDEFVDDPTLSGSGLWNGALITLVGLPSVRFSLFEIDLFFESASLRIRDRGNLIETASAKESTGYYAPLKVTKIRSGCMDEPLKHFYNHVYRMLGDPSMRDNFQDAADLTDWMLRVKEMGQTEK